MKPPVITKGIVLRRTNFQEADRIITVLTFDQGKVSLMVKGARRSKSKLAGGIELFSVSEISFIQGRKEVGTLVSSRLSKHFPGIIKDIDRTMLGYELLKRIDRATEAISESAFFELVETALSALDGNDSLEVIELWFNLSLLKIAGHTPNLRTDHAGQQLDPKMTYKFDLDDMAFAPENGGQYAANHIKLLRLCIGADSPAALGKIQNTVGITSDLVHLSRTMLGNYIKL